MKTFKYVDMRVEHRLLYLNKFLTFLGRRLSNLVKSSLKSDNMWVTKYIYICDVQDCKQIDSLPQFFILYLCEAIAFTLDILNYEL